MFKKFKLFAIFVFSAGFTLSACAPAQTEVPVPTDASPIQTLPAPAPLPTIEELEQILLVDGLGNTLDLPEPAKRIVSLAPSNTELLFAVNAGDTLVGRDSFSDFPEAALNAPDIGGGFAEINTELILSLEPDLILAADITPPEQIQALVDLGLTVFAVPNPTDFDELFDNLLDVGELSGHLDDALLAWDQLEGRVEVVQEKLARVEDLPLVFYQLDSTDVNAPWTPGPGNFIDFLITMAGGENIGASLDIAWVQISAESLIAQNPDIIIVGDFTWGGVTAADVAARPGWESMNAVQNGAVFEFDDNLVSRPGPRLVDGLEAMAALLHPELFE